MWNSVVTNAGLALLASWARGGTLTITGATAGTGTVPAAQLMACTNVAGESHTISIIKYESVTDGIRYVVQLQAAASSYTAMQIGIWAKLDNGSNTLLAIYQADSAETGISVPSYSDMPDFAVRFAATVQMDNTGEYTVTIDTTALVSLGTMEEALAGKLDADAIVDIEHGGTGADDAPGARTNLDVYSKSEVNDKIAVETITSDIFTPAPESGITVNRERLEVIGKLHILQLDLRSSDTISARMDLGTVGTDYSAGRALNAVTCPCSSAINGYVDGVVNCLMRPNGSLQAVYLGNAYKEIYITFVYVK